MGEEEGAGGAPGGRRLHPDSEQQPLNLSSLLLLLFIRRSLAAWLACGMWWLASFSMLACIIYDRRRACALLVGSSLARARAFFVVALFCLVWGGVSRL